MKKVLVTGAAGSLGQWVIKYLLSEGKYEITALDIKSRETMKDLKKYHKRINVIYGDMEEPVLIDALVKDHDVVIHLAGIMPPICNLSPSFGTEIDYIGTENIVRSISFYNPECFLIFPSTTTIYEASEKEVTPSSPIGYRKEDYYSEIKEKCEKLIKNKLKNYVIYRMPFLLGNPNHTCINLYQKNVEIETLTERDAAYALVNTISYTKELNKKMKNITGGASCRINSSDFYTRMLKIYGCSKANLQNSLLSPFRYHGNIFKEDRSLNARLNYQNDTIDTYFLQLEKESTKRKINRFLAKSRMKRLERKRCK